MSSSFLSSDLPNHSISRLSQSSFRGNSPSFQSTPNVRSSQQRHLSQLDSATPLAEYTTYRSQHYSPATAAEGGHHQHHSTTMRSTLSSSSYHEAAASSSNSSNVIGAFRDLQAKVKVIEQERYDAIREREELKAMLLERKRNQNLDRSKQEIETTESLLALRAKGEKIQREYATLQQRIAAQEEISQSLMRKLNSQQSLYNSLHDDINRNQQKFITIEKHTMEMKSQLCESEIRVEQSTDNVTSTSPNLHHKQQSRLLHQIEECERKLEKMRLSKHKSYSKLTSLQSYMDLVIKINGDLCDTLVSRERAKQKLLKMSRSLSPPPRYAWPKDVPYHNVLHVINEAAKATASAAIESNAIHATETAMKQVIRALTPPRSAQDRMFREVLTSASSSSSESEEVDVRRSSRRSSSPMDKLTQSLSQLGVSRSSSDQKKYYLQSASRSSSSPTKRMISFDDNQQQYSDDDDVDYLYGDSDKKKRSSSKKSKKGSKKGRPSSAPATSSHGHLVNTSNRKQTMHKVIARQGAITSATRLAAAANAASMAMKVHATPQDTSYSSHNRSHSRSRGSHAANTAAEDANKVSFIPAGGSKNSEFNIVASVSKASRAAKQLNATIASRVKSLHSGGMGSIFDEVPRVELLDMQHQLVAVKKMRDSLVSM